jgi:hypothetical protein
VFAPLADVPGVGDTCYPSVIREPHSRFLVYNYTSPLDGSDPPWGTALTVGGKAQVVQAVLRGAKRVRVEAHQWVELKRPAQRHRLRP